MGEISPALYRAGEGEPVVLLHGFTGMWRHWRPVLGDLVARFEVIAPTLAGHDGGPPWPADVPLTAASAADYLERHLDELEVDTAHFVGNSAGGALALMLAARGRARSVVGLSPAGGWELGSGEAARVARFFVRQTRLARATQSRLPLVMSRPRSRQLALRDVMRCGFLVPPADALDMVRSSIRCDLVDAVITGIRSEAAIPRDLDQVSAPVLLAWAGRDRIIPAATCSARFRREIPGAEFRLLPRVGHVPMWDDSRLVVDTIVEWVTRHARTEPLGSAAGG